MKLKNVAAVGVLALATAITLSACSSGSGGGSSDNSGSLSGTITAGGSSAQANVQAAWTTAFQADHSDVKINYDKSQGSGGGVTNFLNGSYDFAGTDSPLAGDQFTQAKSVCGGSDGAINLPVYLSGVDVIFKLDGVTSLNLTSQLVAKIFAGKITKWNDPAIVAANSGATLPATAITVVRRSDNSGTTANFTTYLSQVAPTVWSWPASTAWPTIPGDKSSGQEGGSGVVNTVEAGNGTIGYADQSSVADATAAKIQVGTGTDFAAYSPEGATAAFEAAAQDASQGPGDLTKNLDYTKITDASAYPIPLLSYDIVCKTAKNATQGKLTQAYLSFVASSTGQQVGAKNADAAPLPDSVITELAASLKDVK